MASTQGASIPLERRFYRSDHDAYAHDVLKWGFEASSNGSVPGYFIRDGKLVQRGPSIKGPPTVKHTNFSNVSGEVLPVVLVNSSPSHQTPSTQSIRGDQDVYTVFFEHPGCEDTELVLSTIECNPVYVAVVRFSNGQLLRVNPDSGSSNTWILGQGFRITGKRLITQRYIEPDHATYDPTGSYSARYQNFRTFQVKHFDESYVMGHICEDSWSFQTHNAHGGLSQTLLVSSEFGVAEEVTQTFELSEADGTLGLGFASANSAEPPSDSFIASLRKQNSQKKAQFYLCLTNRIPEKPVMYLNGFPPTTIAPSPRHWIDVPANRSEWVIPLTSVGYGEDPRNQNFHEHRFSQPLFTLIDSGTTNCFLPEESVRFVHTKMGCRSGYAGYEIPGISHDRNKNRVWFKFGHEWYPWTLAGISGNPVQNNTPPDLRWYSSRIKSQGRSSTTIMGTAFLESYHAYFETGPSGTRIAFELQAIAPTEKLPYYPFPYDF